MAFLGFVSLPAASRSGKKFPFSFEPNVERAKANVKLKLFSLSLEKVSLFHIFGPPISGRIGVCGKLRNAF